MECRHLNHKLLYLWAKSLTAKKGTEQQRQLLRSVLKNDHVKFVEHIEKSIRAEGRTRDNLYTDTGEIPSLLADNREPIITMEPGHMYLMPAADILSLYKHWQAITYEDAACPSLWGAITLAEIKERRIKPLWLAVHKKCSEEAAHKELADALVEDKNENQEQRTKRDKKIDFLVRRIIRWLAGPGYLRGTIELYENCSLAKAWWCGYLSCQCARDLKINERVVAQALKTIWLGLAEYLSGKLTIFAEPNMVSGIALWADNRINNKAIPGRTETVKILKQIGERTSWCALGLAPPEEICQTAQECDRIVSTVNTASKLQIHK